MNIYVLNTDFEIIGIVSSFKSVIWNMQYYDRGDFQLVIAADRKAVDLLTLGRYLVREPDRVSDNEYHNVVIIEQVQIQEDMEDGFLLTCTGHGLKNILSRRIIWNQTSLIGNLEESIRQVIQANCIGPEIEERIIPNLVLDEPYGITDTIETQLFSENIAEWLVDTCQKYMIGWDIYIKDSNIVFKLYKGTDRTYNQSDNDVVVFSPDFDNLISSSYVHNLENYKNAGLVGGEGEGTDQRTASVGSASGLSRYETYIDGNGVNSNGEIITFSQYNNMLQEYGQTQLDTTAQTEKFSGEIEPSGVYEINKDYFLGDLVQVENDAGIKATPRIIEIIYAEDASGYSVVPTFTEWEVEQ